MRVYILIFFFLFNCSSTKENFEMKFPTTYVGYKNDFHQNLLLNSNGEYLYNNVAGWHRYFSFGKWKKKMTQLY